MSVVRLDVTEIETGEVVHSIDVQGKSERAIERVLMGMLTQIDTDRYFVAELDAAPTQDQP